MSKKELSVYPVGAAVTLNDGKVDAVITGIQIHDNACVTYEVSWWDGKDHACKWLSDLEVVPADGSRLSIGFKGEN